MSMHIMLDIETVGNDVRHGAIVAVGAVAFEMEREIEYPSEMALTWEYGDRTFYVPVDFESQEQFEFKAEVGTLRWWLENEDRAKLLSGFLNAKERRTIREVFEEFQMWVVRVCLKSSQLRLWSHGSTYDIMHFAEKWPIVMNESFNKVCPFRQVRDTRTIFSMYEERYKVSPYPKVERMRHHHPLEDAWIQAKAVQKAWNGLVNGV